MPMLEYPGGAVLQTGVTPQLGDMEGNDEQLTEYRKIAAIIEPIRNKNHIGMHIGNAPTPCFTKKAIRNGLHVLALLQNNLFHKFFSINKYIEHIYVLYNFIGYHS